jgi:hypothetical protein
VHIRKRRKVCSWAFSVYNSSPRRRWRAIAIKGPFLLNERTVKYMMTKTSPGIFVLYTVQNGTPRYVGYDELDVRQKLLKWVGRSYRYFGFEYFGSPEESFHELCELYHQYKKTLDNTRHPEGQSGTEWRCLLCDAAEKKERLGPAGRSAY